jgi:hypothetical protein
MRVLCKAGQIRSDNLNKYPRIKQALLAAHEQKLIGVYWRMGYERWFYATVKTQHTIEHITALRAREAKP